jgi:hypothetical protein
MPTAANTDGDREKKPADRDRRDAAPGTIDAALF